jgi:hypothetical protein
MNLIQGLRGLFPCPKCLVPREFLSDLALIFPARTAEATLNIQRIAEAQETEKNSEFILKSFSLRPVEVK